MPFFWRLTLILNQGLEFWFPGDVGSLAKNVAAKVENAIKQKASQEEIGEILREVPDETGGDQTPNPLMVRAHFLNANEKKLPSS